ncbi:hypothetical protein P3T23_004559 [Paraburkholderia sp. GAS448]|uniref:hypothetical protein n=1 Tax=Paraburkholderia sp. GAS448 TaxID=3035136 RepID=UPI003D20D4D5
MSNNSKRWVWSASTIIAGMFATALVTGCGGGHGAGSTSASSDVSAEQQPDSTPQPAAFSCPAGYKKFDVANSLVPNAGVSVVTDDGIATFTFTTPATGSNTDVVVCLGKPDPIPAGVQADYVYELKAQGALTRLLNRRLTLNFTTDVTPTQIPPAIELAKVSDGAVTYLPVIEGPIYAVRPNYSLTANPNEPGFYVVRLTK